MLRCHVSLLLVLSGVEVLGGGSPKGAGGAVPSRHAVPGVPYVRQSHPNTCGAAALVMLPQYHGKTISEADLVAAYPRMKETGFYIPWLWEHSQKLGFKTASGTGTADDLKKLLLKDTPVIVHQLSAPGKKRPHFRVVMGYDDEREAFVTWDPTPELGPKHEINYETFERLWQVPYYGGKTHLYFAIIGTGGAEDSHYAIVVGKEALEEAGWRSVVEALRKKHSATIFHPGRGDVGGLREELAAFRPRHVCFVARPEELAREAKARLQTRDGRSLELPLCGMAYRDMVALMASLDDDPCDDAQWAVLTGATPQDALRVVCAGPLAVCRGLSHVGSGWLEWLESGVSFSEGKKGQMWSKQSGKPPEERAGPDDTTKAFIGELNSGKVDMVSTSGHATEHDWQLGFSYPNGQITTPSGMAKLAEAARTNYQELLKGKASRDEQAVARLLGVDTSNQVFEVLTDNPKVYFSPGNCRIARVEGKDCMALGWIHHGAMQFFGHVGLQTSSCYAWGVAEYFLALQGRFTFAEAVWLNQQALRWELSQMSDQERKQQYICCRNDTPLPAEGKLFWGTTVLYGDPAWEARVKPVTAPLYEQGLRRRELGDGRIELTFSVKMCRASLPSRPAAFLLELGPVSSVEVKEGPGDLVVAENFALVSFWKAGEPAPEAGREYKAVVIVRQGASGK